MSRFGKGKTLMLGSYVSAAYYSTPAPEAGRFFAGLTEWAGVTPPVQAAGGQLEVRTLTAGADTLLFVFNHGQQSVDAAVAVRSAASQAFDLVSGDPVETSRDGDLVQLKTQIAPADVWVVRLTP
jgi:beta-galactosidase